MQNLVWVGINALQEYLGFHVLLGLIPAFFLAGAITSLFPKENILRLVGADAPKSVSYPVAAISGCVLAVCSCTVLPLFAGIYRRGAGIGPATTFLFSAPAINILAIVYTAQILGYTLGATRAIAAIGMSIVIGLVMAAVFTEHRKIIQTREVGGRQRATILFVLLVAMLISGGINYIIFAGIGVITTIYAYANFSREELTSWIREVWFLLRSIVPLLLTGIFFAGIITELLPQEVISTYLGGNTLKSNGIAGISGAIMYFCTLLEVPIISALTKLGMGTGPALTMLLAGPALSLPNILVITRTLGRTRGLTYIGLVIIISIVSGLIFGALS